jgi:hypothetical protein
VHVPLIGQAFFQGAAGQGLACGIDEAHAVGDADAQAGSEVVRVHCCGVRAGLQPCSAAEPAAGSTGNTELQPDIADPGGAGGTLSHEVPVHRPLGGAERGQSAGT